MNRNTLSQGECYEPTTTSADSSQVMISGTAVKTATQPKLYPVIEVRLDEVAWPDGYRSVDDLIEESEKDSARKAALEDARRWAADTFYSNEKSLRAIRLKKGLSQARLAALVGTTQAHIARIESGDTDVQVGTLVRLAKALGTEDLAAIEAFLTMRRETVAT